MLVFALCARLTPQFLSFLSLLGLTPALDSSLRNHVVGIFFFFFNEQSVKAAVLLKKKVILGCCYYCNSSVYLQLLMGTVAFL